MLLNFVVFGSLAASAAAQALYTDLNVISTLWGQISPYKDNAEEYFGVKDIGLPSGCQVEQAHSLQRHAQRFPTGGDVEGGNAERFAAKVKNFTSVNGQSGFTGPLSFLNSYSYRLGESYLTGLGAATEFSAGVAFWNRYGRILYNATQGQLAYNASAADGSPRRRPVLRTTGQSRIENSEINWALGFFGPSFQVTPNPTLQGANTPFDVVIIPEGGSENNTLASYDSCFNDYIDAIGYNGDRDTFTFLNRYLGPATSRLQRYAPPGFTFNVNDTYAMQYICAAESGYLGLGASSFCGLFTLEEWQGFEKALSILYYYDYAWGNPTGRAQGLGYLQELLARLQNQYITSSNSSVNYTIDNNAAQFPLGEPFYADFTHDDIIISTLTAMSFDYFKDPPSLTDPRKPSRFDLSHLTPFGGRLVTEVIGCASPNPAAVGARTQYYPSQYGYDPANAKNKFVRFRVNHGILPVDTIRGGLCAGRTDGLCPLDRFLQSQADAEKLANYQFACFGNYTADYTSGQDFDGTIFADGKPPGSTSSASSFKPHPTSHGHPTPSQHPSSYSPPGYRPTGY